MTWLSTLSHPHSPPAGQQGHTAASAAPWPQQCSGAVLQLLTPDPGSPTVFARLGEECNNGVCQCLCHWMWGKISIILLPLEPVFSDLQISLHIWGFPDVSVVKNPPANAGDSGTIPGSGRFPGGGHGNPLQHSCLENPIDRGAWWAIVHGVAQGRHD